MCPNDKVLCQLIAKKFIIGIYIGSDTEGIERRIPNILQDITNKEVR